MMYRILPGLAVLAVGLAACASSGGPEAEMSQEQACLIHNENDPAQRDRCRLDASVRSDTVPDVRPMDLPIRNGQMGD
jgi:hypothetical protein